MTEALGFIGSVDLCGLLRGKSVPSAALERRLGRGVGIAPSLLLAPPFGPGRERFGLGDLVLIPDPAARALIPVRDAPDIVLLLGDVLELDGSPWECCPRYFLRRGLAALHAEFGLTVRAGFAQELIYTGAGGRGGSGLEALRRQGGFGGRLLAAARANGIEPERFQPASGPGRYEIGVAPASGVEAADQAVIVRELARAVAAGSGHRAILAPDEFGSATSIHWSLRDEFGQPATHDEGGVRGLSIEAEHMAAGMLHHLAAIVAVTKPSPASYGLAAPLWPELGGGDRGAPLRLSPASATSDEPAAAQIHLEFRAGDATANPYLALGALVWAGLDGLQRRRRLAEVARVAAPATLEAALEAFEESVAAAEWFGPVLREAYGRVKRDEIAAAAGLDGAALGARYAALY